MDEMFLVPVETELETQQQQTDQQEIVCSCGCVDQLETLDGNFLEGCALFSALFGLLIGFLVGREFLRIWVRS